MLVMAAGASGCGEEQSGQATAELDANEWLPGGETTNTLLLGSNAFSMPLPNATREHELAFFTGNSFFTNSWVQAPASTEARDGLGPLFNARSCAVCHQKDGRGSPPLGPDPLLPEEPFIGLLLRLGIPGETDDGSPLPEPNYGDQLQPFATPELLGEGTPRVTYRETSGSYADGTSYTLLEPSYAIVELNYGPLHPELLISPRVAPAMIGLGLLEAIPEERLRELADPEDADGDGISGRLQRVPDRSAGVERVGRFGWKAEQPSVQQQAAAAFHGDIGISTSLFSEQPCTPAQPACSAAIHGGEPELADELLGRVATYSRMLAVPVRELWNTSEVLRGKLLFQQAGCAGCHVPQHVTGQLEDFAELAAQTIWPYTDLLLHDLGPELSDERPVFGANGREWRTPPLWGLRLYSVVNGHERLLHDGRARGVAEAILWHGGEAEGAREAFRALPAADRAALLQFVESL